MNTKKLNMEQLNQVVGGNHEVGVLGQANGIPPFPGPGWVYMETLGPFTNPYNEAKTHARQWLIQRRWRYLAFQCEGRYVKLYKHN